jgi:hypothetical protein
LHINQVMISSSQFSSERVAEIVSRCALAGIPVFRAGMVFQQVSATEFGWVMPNDVLPLAPTPLVTSHPPLVHPAHPAVADH